MKNTMLNIIPHIGKRAINLFIACSGVIFVCTFFANAQNVTPQNTAQGNTITPSIRQSGDTIIFNAPPVLGATLSCYGGYSPLNSAAFNAVMEKNGYAPLGTWVYSVGLGRNYAWNNFHVAVYGYFGFTPNNPPSNSNMRSSLLSFGLDEYLGYIVAQNETFRLFPQVGLHLNWRSFTSSDRSASIDASALQLSPSALKPLSSLTMTGLDMAASIGIAGDVRIPFQRLFKVDGAEAVYREDLIIGVQAGYALDLFPSNSSIWQTNGTRVSNLPSVSMQGFVGRITFTTDLHLLK